MAGRTLLLALHLLDHQVIDTDGLMAGKVDDVELSFTDPEHPHVSALLSGPGVLATRLGRRGFGPWRERMEHHIDSPSGRTARIPLGAVREVGSGIRVNLAADQLAAWGSERWVADHLIGHIPGSGIDPSPGDSPGAGHDDASAAPPGAPVEGADEPRGGAPEGLRASTLLGRPVTDLDGRRIGIVLDVRLVQDGPTGATFDARMRVDGLVVGHGRFLQRSGLLRHEVHGPWLLRAVAVRLGPRRRYLEWPAVVDPAALPEGGPVRATAATGPLPD
jgi:sporulation protein YlmC with PRC-barrel domain